jgi:predicted Co/Zn/Cd cation transporter (cation efflux family)
MEANQIFNFISSGALTDGIFKVAMIFLSVLFLLYSIVIAKQVKIMDKSLEASFNQVIFLVCSIQTTVALILVIFAVFLN